MASEVHHFQATVPSGTTKAGALLFNFNIPPRVVDQIEIEVPPGPRGEVGWQIALSGGALFPYEPGAFVVTDDRTTTWQVENQNTGGAWGLIAYNTGKFNHTLYVRLLTRLPEEANPLPALPPPLSLHALSHPPTPLNGGPAAPGLSAPPAFPAPPVLR